MHIFSVYSNFCIFVMSLFEGFQGIKISALVITIKLINYSLRFDYDVWKYTTKNIQLSMFSLKNVDTQ